MIPEIWLPTWTLTTGFNCPLAVTFWTTSPRAMAAVRYSGGLSTGCFRYQVPKPVPAPSRTRIISHLNQRNLDFFAIIFALECQ